MYRFVAAYSVEQRESRSKIWVEMFLRNLNSGEVISELYPRPLSVAERSSHPLTPDRTSEVQSTT
jgi:hypothetical protein